MTVGTANRSLLRRLRLKRWRSPPQLSSGWRWVTRVGTLIAVIAVGWIFYSGFHTLDWDDVQRSLHGFQPSTIACAAALALLSTLIAASYDLLGRHYEQHSIRAPRCVAIGFVAYVVSINLSSLLGSWALRYRLYSREGLATPQITRIAMLAVTTNWLGFAFVAGTVFAFSPSVLPAAWPIHAGALQIVGVLLLSVAAAYILFCQKAQGQGWQLKKVALHCPTPGFALAQASLSSLAWITAAAVPAQFLPDSVRFMTTLEVICLAAIAGLIVRLPAGIGVIESVFIAVLGKQIGIAATVAALLAYRAIYLLLPLCAAFCVYLAIEFSGRRSSLAARPLERSTSTHDARLLR